PGKSSSCHNHGTLGSGRSVTPLPRPGGTSPASIWHWCGSPCILQTVRWISLVALSLAAGQAEARPPRSAPRDDRASVLWREVIEPHGIEVAALVARARVAM